MTARGVDFLDKWIAQNILPNAGDRTVAQKLAQKLINNAVGADLRISELELGDSEVVTDILEGRNLGTDAPFPKVPQTTPRQGAGD